MFITERIKYTYSLQGDNKYKIFIGTVSQTNNKHN